jgi:hypothetical protein
LIAAVALAAYLVQPGDTLSGIASSHGVSLAAVEAANPQISNPNLIFAGQNVNLSGGGSAQGSSYGSQGYHSQSGYTQQASTPKASQTYRSPSSISSASQAGTGRSSGYSGSSGGGYSSSSLTDIPGVPQSFAACVAYRESTNGTNQAYNGGVYGIIRASGVNVNGQSLAAQKQAFSQLYKQYGGHPWAADGCPGT